MKLSRVGLAALLAIFAAACFGSHEDIDGADGTLRGSADEPEERFLVQMNDYAAGLSAIRGAGGSVRLEIPARGLVSAALPDGAIAALRRNPAVDRVERDQVRRPMEETNPWGISRVQADAVTNPETGNPYVGDKTVCIIDGGYWRAHEDLPDTVTGEPDGWDTSECPHGTHVAGTIAALGGNDEGVVGVLPDTVPIHSVQVFGGTDCGWTYSSSLIAAVDACRAAGASVINMSLGGGGFSDSENTAFQDAFAAGVLSFAAAGNDGTTGLSYPASYASVISVGATTDADTRADFSQHNEGVELSAPGQSVLSTVQYQSTNDLTVGGESFAGGEMEGSTEGTGTGTLVNGGDCNTTPDRNAYRGQIVLCERGGATFRDKADNVNRGRAEGMIVYNNVPGSVGGTLGSGRTYNFPIVTLSDTQGADALAHVGEEASVTVGMVPNMSGYDTFSGTSMATPHAAGVAALVWSAVPAASAQQVRTALIASADDLGGAGRDVDFGHGLVLANDAISYLGGTTAANCVPDAGQEVVETSCDDSADNDCDGAVDADDSDCSADSGGGGSDVCDGLGMPGDSCADDSECCFNICRGKGDKRKCR
jgi:subtilisin family serine protease